MKYEITTLLVALIATTITAGTILGASAMYPYGSNPVLMAQAQDEMVAPEAGIKQGGGEGVEEATEVFGPNETLPADGMIVETIEEPAVAVEEESMIVAPTTTLELPKQAPLPLPEDKPVLTPIEEPVTPLPENTTVQTAAPVVEEECTPAEISIVTEANATAEEVITVIEENVMNTAVVENVTEVVENVTAVIEESVQNNATTEVVQNVTEEVVEVVEETPDIVESPTAEETKLGLIQLLTELVAAQDFNENLTAEERDSLDQNLEAAKGQLTTAFT